MPMEEIITVLYAVGVVLSKFKAKGQIYVLCTVPRYGQIPQEQVDDV